MDIQRARDIYKERKKGIKILDITEKKTYVISVFNVIFYK